jgi:cytochrome c oxidase subunit 2
MKNSWKVLGIIGAMSLVLAGCGTASASSGSSNNGAQVVHVTASNYKWSIDKNQLKAGQPTEFDLTAQEGMHGFSIDGTDVSQQVMQGQDQKVLWTPPKAGTYTIRCNLMCGTGHGDMLTTFTVS